MISRQRIFSSCITALMLLSLTCCHTHQEEDSEYFPIYNGETIRLDLAPLGEVPIVGKYVKINSEWSVSRKVKALLDSISVTSFGNRKIEFMRIDTIEGIRILKVNLYEKPNLENDHQFNINREWYNRFQGSTGGSYTTTILTESILQRQYKGAWIDAVYFFWNKEPFPFEMDHAKLYGVIARYDLDFDDAKWENIRNWEKNLPL